MRTRFLIALLAIFMLFAERPGTLSGRVTADSAPLKDVEVTISAGPASYSDLTDRHGRFSFAPLKAAHYDLTARKAGYETFRQRYAVSDGKQTHVEVKLVRK